MRQRRGRDTCSVPAAVTMQHNNPTPYSAVMYTHRRACWGTHTLRPPGRCGNRLLTFRHGCGIRQCSTAHRSKGKRTTTFGETRQTCHGACLLYTNLTSQQNNAGPPRPFRNCGRLATPALLSICLTLRCISTRRIGSKLARDSAESKEHYWSSRSVHELRGNWTDVRGRTAPHTCEPL